MGTQSATPAGSKGSGEGRTGSGLERRRFLTYLVAAPVLTVAAKAGFDSASADAEIPSPPAVADVLDMGDALNLAYKPTENNVVLEVGEDGKVWLRLHRTEVGQGITTTFAMLVAEEMDLRLDQVEVPLRDADPALLFNQLTGGSDSVRALYAPVRRAAAAARSQLVAAAAKNWNLDPARLWTKEGSVVAPDGRTATYASLTAAAAKLSPAAGATLKDPSQFTLVGKPTGRIDARKLVTGQLRYTMDLDVPGAKPTMVRRPPTIRGTPKAVLNEVEVRAMPGVIDLAVVETGVAVMAETFGQALDAKDALKVDWNPGTIDGLSDADIKKQLRAAMNPLADVPPLAQTVDANFDFAFVSHAPLETNCAIADVRSDRAEIWSGMKIPIIALQTIAKEVGLPEDKVTAHVMQSGGSFGRRLFFDGALEAARVSKAMGRPVKLMWSRIDDMRHGRARARSYHKLRATLLLNDVVSYQQFVATTETDYRHGLGETLTASGVDIIPTANLGFAKTAYALTVKCPYNFGVVATDLHEIPIHTNTAAWRSVYSAQARGAEEILVDEIAAKLGKDPYAFRLARLKDENAKAVLRKVAEEGDWGRSMPAGFAQGIGFHEEYRSREACLVELDARDPKNPRVTKAVIAVDVGLPINPRGIQAQMLGGLTDAISTVLRAGLHIDNGLPLEGSYSQFHYARQNDSPLDAKVFVMPPTSDDPGGAGELGIPAPAGAIANAYTRATGIKPRSFPINDDIDFEPFPR